MDAADTTALPPVISLRSAKKPGGMSEVIDPPEWLTERGTEIWTEYFPRYVLTLNDLAEFAAFVEAVAEYQEATDLLRDVGLVVVDPATGVPIPNPITTIRDRADHKIAFWSRRFPTK